MYVFRIFEDSDKIGYSDARGASPRVVEVPRFFSRYIEQDFGLFVKVFVLFTKEEDSSVPMLSGRTLAHR